MEVIEEVVDGGALLEQVQLENRDFYREIFQNEDSDEEFLRFDADDLENDDEIAPAMIDFFHLYINEGFIDLLVEETNRYVTAFFRSVQQLKSVSVQNVERC